MHKVCTTCTEKSRSIMSFTSTYRSKQYNSGRRNTAQNPIFPPCHKLIFIHKTLHTNRNLRQVVWGCDKVGIKSTFWRHTIITESYHLFPFSEFAYFSKVLNHIWNRSFCHHYLAGSKGLIYVLWCGDATSFGISLLTFPPGLVGVGRRYKGTVI